MSRTRTRTRTDVLRGPLLAGTLALLAGGCAVESAATTSTAEEPESIAPSANSDALSIVVGDALLVTRNATPPGTSVLVSGSGFSAGEEVRFSLDAVSAGEAVADGSGQVAFVLAVDDATLPGVYMLRAEASPSRTSGSARFAVRTDFAQGGFSANQARYNRYENVIGAENVQSVVRRWRSANWAPMQGRLTVASRRIFALARDGLRVQNPDGTVTVNRTVAAFGAQSRDRMWYALLGPGASDSGPGGSDSAAAAYGHLYLGASEGLRVFAQDCRTDGGECTPLWTGLTGSHASSPTVHGNVVYVNSGGTLYAFPSQCEASTCGPLWTGRSGGDWSVNAAVYKNTVYVTGASAAGDQVVLSAYATGCRSDGGECAPLWQSAVAGTYVMTPVLSNDRIFVSSGDALRVYRYDCGAGGITCTPLWKATGTRFNTPPTVAEGVVYGDGQQTQLFPADSYGQSAWSVSCRSNGGECRPLFRFGSRTSYLNPSAYANGVLYRNASGHAVTGCVRDGTICNAPLWTPPSENTSPNGWGGSATISDGVLYLPGLDRKLYAYGLPTN